MSPWVFNAHTGGSKIPERDYAQIRARIHAHCAKLYPTNRVVVDIRFRGVFCYVDAYEKGSDQPIHLCRLRFFAGREEWSLAFYTYSSERYEPCFLSSGAWCGTLEEAFETGSMYLKD